MKVGPLPSPTLGAWSVQLSQRTCRLAAHRSTPTDRPVEAPGALPQDTLTRRPSRHTFDIRV